MNALHAVSLALTSTLVACSPVEESNLPCPCSEDMVCCSDTYTCQPLGTCESNQACPANGLCCDVGQRWCGQSCVPVGEPCCNLGVQQPCNGICIPEDRECSALWHAADCSAQDDTCCSSANQQFCNGICMPLDLACEHEV